MKPSAMSIVQAKHPNARSERQKGSDRKVYWLIRLGQAQMYFAEGDTESKAWKKAAEKIARNETK